MKKVAIVVAVFVVVGVLVAISHQHLLLAILWRDRSVPIDEAEKTLITELQAQWHLTLSQPVHVLHCMQEGGMEGGRWWLFELPPEYIPALKRNLISRGPSAGGSWVIEDADAVSTNIFRPKNAWPSWWHPDKLVDADMLRVSTGTNYANAYWFALSPKSGLVYMYKNAS